MDLAVALVWAALALTVVANVPLIAVACGRWLVVQAGALARALPTLHLHPPTPSGEQFDVMTDYHQSLVLSILQK